MLVLSREDAMMLINTAVDRADIGEAARIEVVEAYELVLAAVLRERGTDSLS